MRVLLITGGQSSEHEISRCSCTNIRKHIDNRRYDVNVIGIDLDGTWYLLSNSVSDFNKDDWLNGSAVIADIFSFLKQFDVVFPVLHGKNGEDGTIQGLLEIANVPYVGCKVSDSAICMDKVLTKKILKNTMIKQVPCVFIKKTNKTFYYEDVDLDLKTNILEKVNEEVGYPCFVKASRSGSSIGCYKVSNESQLKESIHKAGAFDNKVIIEKAVNGIELECAVLGNDELIVSEVGQILSNGDFYSFEAKYHDNTSKTCIPADISYSVSEKIRKWSAFIYKMLDCHGLARCDFFFDVDKDELYFNEINTMPGFTSISMYPSLMDYSGINYQELIDELIRLALEK